MKWLSITFSYLEYFILDNTTEKNYVHLRFSYLNTIFFYAISTPVSSFFANSAQPHSCPSFLQCSAEQILVNKCMTIELTTDWFMFSLLFYNSLSNVVLVYFFRGIPLSPKHELQGSKLFNIFFKNISMNIFIK